MVTRRSVLIGSMSLVAGRLLVACASEATTDGDDESGPTSPADTTSNTSGSSTSIGSEGGPSAWSMPAEEEPHERTWMCWPSSTEVWGSDLGAVQDDIIRIAQAISQFEPVTMFARAEELDLLADVLGDDVELVEGPVDDLWARDTLPHLVVRTRADGAREVVAAHATFNGWGDKQIHDGDTQLAAILADLLGIELFNPGLVGEGGAIEVDGRGTVLAAESCWVNENRNPGMSRDEIESAILEMVGADRVIWIDGLAGYDITDGHIDTLARFTDAGTIVVDEPAFDDPDDPWVEVAARTKEQVEAALTADGDPYEVVAITQPSEIRGSGDDFLATYMNYYVCNGAVIAPEFGDEAADDAARDFLAELFPDREIVLVAIDALAGGGGGMHCATQQQPAIV